VHIQLDFCGNAIAGGCALPAERYARAAASRDPGMGATASRDPGACAAWLTKIAPAAGRPWGLSHGVRDLCVTDVLRVESRSGRASTGVAVLMGAAIAILASALYQSPQGRLAAGAIFVSQAAQAPGSAQRSRSAQRSIPNNTRESAPGHPPPSAGVTPAANRVAVYPLWPRNVI
jgi:hypothetical protein